jgi:hypothetical protein
MARQIGLHVVSTSRSFSECTDMPYVYPTDILIILSRLATHYQLCVQGGQTTSNKMCIIDNKQSHLQERISLFEHQADSFLLHQQPLDTSDIPAMEDYDQYDDAELSYLESTDNYKYDTLAVGRMIVQ